MVTTLLLNFVILLFVSYLLEGPLKDPMLMGWPQAAPIIDEGVLPRLVERSRLHLGLVVAVAAALLVWLVMTFTVWGYEIRAGGDRKSTRLNSSHVVSSYAVFCWKKKKLKKR